MVKFLLILSGLIRLDISDHLPIFVALKSSNQPVVKDNMNFVTRAVNQIRIDKLTQYLSSITWDFMTNTSCINDDYDKFINTVVTSVNKCLPVKTYNHAVTTSPWLTPAIRKSCHQKQKLYLTVLKNMQLWDNYITHRNKLNSLIRIRENDYYREFIFNHKRDSRAMWRVIDNCIGRSCLSVPCFYNMTADDLNNFFINLGPITVKNISPRNSFSKYLHKRILSSFYIKPVTNQEILTIAKQLSSKTSYD